MKKALSLLISLVMIFSLFAATVAAEGEAVSVKVVMTEQDFSDGLEIDAGNGITISFAKGNGQSAPAYSNPEVRVYLNNTITISVSSETDVITSITFTLNSNKSSVLNASVGTYEDGSWAGSTNSVIFTNPNSGKTGQVWISAITVNLNGATEEPPVTYDTPEEILAAAYELSAGETLEGGSYTLEGVITAVNDPYSIDYKNITVTIQVDEVTAENNKIMCYRLVNGSGIDAVDKLAVNDHIKVTGNIKNYKGTVEFDAGCTLVEYEEGEHNEVVIYETPAEILAAAYELESGVMLSEGYEYTLEGVIIEVNTEYSEDYKNITVTIAVDGVTAENNTIQCYRMKDATGVDGVSKIAVNDHIKVKGAIQKYGDIVEFKQNCTLEEYTLSPRFMTQQLSLAGDLGVHFYLDLSSLSEDERAASYMEFTVSGKTVTVGFDPENMNAAGEYYGFTCRVNVLQMAENIHAVFHYGDSTVETDYSVEEYIDYIFEHADDYDAATVNLVSAICNYGYNSQQYLHECNGVKLGENGYAAQSPSPYEINPPEDYSTLDAMEKLAELDGGAKFTYCLVLDSEITLELYVTVPDGEIFYGIQALFDNETYDNNEDLGGGRFRVTIPGISATQLETRIEVLYDGTFVRRLCPLSYAAAVKNADISENASNWADSLASLYRSAVAYANND